MTKSEAVDVILNAIKGVCDHEVKPSDILSDHLDSLERATVAVELNDSFPDANLIEDERFFRAFTVQDLIDVICEKVS
jgi:acyl carrier protein